MLDKLTKEERTVLIFWIIFGVILAGVLIVVLSIRSQNANKFNEKPDSSYYIVYDYNRYYTIINIMETYYSTINKKNYDDTLLLLNDKYKEKNEIYKENITDKITYYDKDVTYKGDIMCQKKLGNGYTSYYVSGRVIGMNNSKTYATQYYDVLLNEKEMTFTISLIDEGEFGGNCHA